MSLLIYILNLFIFFHALKFVGSYTQDALIDQIISLPYSTSENLSNQFSGFLDILEDHSRFIHYIYFESESNPSTDPVIFW